MDTILQDKLQSPVCSWRSLYILLTGDCASIVSDLSYQTWSCPWANTSAGRIRDGDFVLSLNCVTSMNRWDWMACVNLIAKYIILRRCEKTLFGLSILRLGAWRPLLCVSGRKDSKPHSSDKRVDRYKGRTVSNRNGEVHNTAIIGFGSLEVFRSMFPRRLYSGA